jgi:stage IV sporulation protein FB
MAFQDRHYYREGGGSTSNPLLWILTGSVPLFTAFGIRVRAHASLVITIILILLFGFGQPGPLQERVVSSSVLFLIVLLHEFGHCFAARWVGGEADEILMHPLGGLALTRPPQRPWPMFVTVAGGPGVNVVICLLCGALLYFISGQLPWNPFNFMPFYSSQSTFSWLNIAMYTWWIYQMSWMLLCFNLLPIFPLDGGQMLQTILWPHFGYYKSMMFACITGMIGAVVAGMIGLATGQLFLIILAALGFMTCMNMRQQLKAAGPWAFQEDEGTYAAAYEPVTPKRKAPSKWSQRRARKAMDTERAEQQKIDAILAKVSAHGMHSLSWLEKRTLRNATERQRKRDSARARHS